MCSPSSLEEAHVTLNSLSVSHFTTHSSVRGHAPIFGAPFSQGASLGPGQLERAE